jgi:hypothetical protein
MLSIVDKSSGIAEWRLGWNNANSSSVAPADGSGRIEEAGGCREILFFEGEGE